jgi:ABC-type Fe3+-citrate transport system substrate-binding protein
MKTSSILLITFLLIVIGCGQTNNESQENDTNSPGPVTESDKQRYNLNSNDELIYGSTDTLNQDSLRADSLGTP